MLLPQEAIYQSYTFKQDVKEFGYNTEFKELSFSKGNRNYNRILKTLQEVTLPNPSSFVYNKLTLEELKSLIKEILIKILGPSYSSKIDYLNSLLNVTNTSEMYDSVLEEEKQGKDFILKRIHINRQLATIQVASTSHEYIHALLSPYNGQSYNRVLSNIHYKELLSILTEYLVIYDLSELLKDLSIQSKLSMIRAKHNQDHAIEHNAVEKLKVTCNTLRLNPQTVADLRMYFDYEAHNSFGYIISDIYARRLFELYKDDPQHLLTIIRQIIKGESSINHLLHHYDISLTNIPTLETFNKEIERIRIK